MPPLNAVVDVHVQRQNVDQLLGFVLATNEDEDGVRTGNSVVAEVKEGSVAEQFGVLPGDQLLAIDGSAVDNLSHNEMLGQLKNTLSPKLAMLRPAAPIASMVFTCTLERPKPSVGFGFMLQSMMDGSVEIGTVLEGSLAEKNKLTTGDRILLINGNAVDGMSHEDCTELIKQTQSAVMTIMRQTTLPMAAIVASLTITRPKKNAPLGIHLGTKTDGSVEITEVVVNSLAAAAGVAKDDRILMIDGEFVDNKDHFEVVEMTKNSTVNLTLLRLASPNMESVILNKTLTRPNLESGFGLVIASTDDGGVEVADTIPDLIANKAGIQGGDRIIKINGKPTHGGTHDGFIKEISSNLTANLDIVRIIDESEA
eukprot:m.331541 g.331541  ORF g.331541 m.331541 type:complete len:369 (-) comp16752_c0_seq1:113-1219(-)